MRICADSHEAIVIDYNSCPLCAARRELEEIKLDLAHANEQNYNLEDEVKELKIRIGEFKDRHDEPPERDGPVNGHAKNGVD